jgi:FADH2 O2-dependent halogenase
MIAHQIGRSVILIERGSHPRFAIGESSTPLSNLLLEEIANRYQLSSIKPLTKWGTWQKTNPEIACGLKRGFTFYHHVLGSACAPYPDRQRQLLVAASPRDEIADTHWFRADFDQYLVQEAERLGVTYLDQIEIERIESTGRDVRLEGVRNGNAVSLRAKFVVDATGPRGFLHHSFGLREIEFPDYPRTQALYSHFTSVQSLAGLSEAQLDQPTPYPIDDAAVHHMFEGGWIWLLRFNNGVTSAGVAATPRLAAKLNLADGDAAWSRLLDMLPLLREQFRQAQVVQPFSHIPRLAFRSAMVTGDRWALLPSAAGFVDPLLSTGFPTALLGISRFAEILDQDWETSRFWGRLQNYAAQTDAELVAVSRLIASLYTNFDNFPVFVALSMLYFAAASFSEAARRLGKAHLAPSFLLHDDPRFGPALRNLCDRAQMRPSGIESSQLISEILEAIEPFNVAGLGQNGRRNWYPVDADDFLNAAGKLGASRDEISSLLLRCGFVKQSA